MTLRILAAIVLVLASAGCGQLRDMGVPFSHNRHGGADHAVEHAREHGQLKGMFKRFRALGSDWDTEAPFVVEEF